jgi:hypothetical protein
MYHEVGLDALSKKQVSKLLNGHPVRVKVGSGVKALVSAEHLKKLTKAGMKGCGITVSLDPYAIAKNQHLRKAVGMLMGRGTGHDVAKSLGNAAIAGTDAASVRLVRAIEGSGLTDTITSTISPLLNKYTTPAQKAMVKQQAKQVIHGLGLYGRGTGHDVAKSLGNAAIAGTDAASARLVRSIEGSGIGRNVAKALGKAAISATNASAARLVRALEGSGTGHDVAKSLGNAAIAGTNASSDRLVRALEGSGRKMSGRGKKKSSTEHFRDWTKNIGQVFKPLNRGALGAAKRQVIGAAGNAISDEISNQGNPYIDGAELFSQGMAGMDGDPSTQGINLGSDVPVQQTRYQMRKAKIAARPQEIPYRLPYGQEPVYATPIFDKRTYAAPTYSSPAVSKSLGLPPLPSGAYEDSYEIPVGQLYGSGLKKMPKHLRPKRVMSEAQKAALAKGRHNLRLKLESMGAGVKKHRKTPKHRKKLVGSALLPAGGALRAGALKAAGY